MVFERNNNEAVQHAVGFVGAGFFWTTFFWAGLTAWGLPGIGFLEIGLVGMTKKKTALVEADATSSFFLAFAVRSSNHKKNKVIFHWSLVKLHDLN